MGKLDALKFTTQNPYFKLEKFDGEKVPGDGKQPVEVIEGGDGLPNLLTMDTGAVYIQVTPQVRQLVGHLIARVEEARKQQDERESNT